MSSYIYINNGFINTNEASLKPSNRAFRYGDSLFESMRFTGGKIQFFKEHFKRLMLSAKILQYNLPADFNESLISDIILQLKEKNNIENDARIRLTIHRNEGGYYAPSTNDSSFLIEIDSLPETGYTLNIKGLHVDIYPEIKKSRNMFASFKNGNSLIYVMAGLYKKQKQLDDCILLNDKDNVIEASSSNIFTVKNGVLYTAPLDEGCINGIMRQEILEIAKQNKISVYEIALAFNVMLNADEVFLTDAVNGIRWVGAYKNKRYFNNTAKLFNEKLNQKVEKLNRGN